MDIAPEYLEHLVIGCQVLFPESLILILHLFFKRLKELVRVQKWSTFMPCADFPPCLVRSSYDTKAINAISSDLRNQPEERAIQLIEAPLVEFVPLLFSVVACGEEIGDEAGEQHGKSMSQIWTYGFNTKEYL